MDAKETLFSGMLAAVILSSGCAEHSTTVHRDVVTTPAGSAVATTTPTSVTVTPAPATQVTTTTTTTKERESTSVLGTIFDVLGEILALPFRLIAGIFRFVF